MNDQFDVIIKDIEIVDGSGSPAYLGSIGIKGERITALGKIPAHTGRIIDGKGLIACPGFIDSHSHADRTILNYPRAENLIMQGITTFVGGNCGHSIAPVGDMSYFKYLQKIWKLDFEPGWNSFGEWLLAVETEGLSPNYAPLVGHNTVRGAIMGERYSRRADDSEIMVMDAYVNEAMENGAFGMSIGLDANMPGHFSGRDELLRLLKTVKGYDGIFSPHTRHHQNQWPSDSPTENAYGLYQGPKGELFAGRYHGLLEAVELAALADNIRLLIAHLTPAYSIPQPHPDFLDDALSQATLRDIIDKARGEGIDVYANVIPSEYSIGGRLPIIASFFNHKLSRPDWLKNMSKDEFIHGLSDSEFADQVKEFVYSGKFKFGMINPVTDPYWSDCYRVLSCRNRDFEGKTIGELAAQRGNLNIAQTVYEYSLSIVFEILKDDPDSTWTLIRDKREFGVLSAFLQHPDIIPITDVYALPAKPKDIDSIDGYGVSPAAYNMFPNYLAEFVKNRKELSLGAAVRKLTSLPAQEIFHFKDRGILKPGKYADIVIMDFPSITVNDCFMKPNTPPPGIKYVFVNGEIAYENGKHTDIKSGKVLRR